VGLCKRVPPDTFAKPAECDGIAGEIQHIGGQQYGKVDFEQMDGRLTNIWTTSNGRRRKCFFGRLIRCKNNKRDNRKSQSHRTDSAGRPYVDENVLADFGRNKVETLKSSDV